jgi:hypothetical protein
MTDKFKKKVPVQLVMFPHVLYRGIDICMRLLFLPTFFLNLSGSGDWKQGKLVGAQQTAGGALPTGSLGSTTRWQGPLYGGPAPCQPHHRTQECHP